MDRFRRTELTENEQKIFSLIRKNPYISQQALADSISLSRPSVANIISSLMKKELIKGKAYIVNETAPVVCIGGANVDRKYTAKQPLQWGTSNPTSSVQSAGGVARNVAENLGRMEMDTVLITAAGNDVDWQLIHEATSPFADLERTSFIPGATTGSYSAVLSPDGEMALAMADMEVFEAITPAVIRQNEALLAGSACLIADLNCPKETVEEVRKTAHRGNIPLAVLAVSAPKMKRLPDSLDGVTWLVTNRKETEEALGLPLESPEEWQQACDQWLAAGTEKIIITDGAAGAVHASRSFPKAQHVTAPTSAVVVDVTGAGDAFAAAMIRSQLDGAALEESVQAGIGNAQATLAVSETVRRDLHASSITNYTETEAE
ncbi:carbohydrate kinase [Alkalicoccus halolimnae]|uniref:Carbohydrate kinase n=1 Tax=Alkalicoccus halolimnae TaxID=1667239 RepID=A0A5C7FDZ7_9BACI|nr:carbohydrate kinase [Alkalicoccus halolimnae]TXF83594.1 winged helix-turn-helix transcriptional regulator [Alkalicoccus halolimnae]